ncbi:MAG: hypothetical protein HQL73_05630 [Magnetococcales bacterium]|nr:hypothetical protein [Magnetococcales bacterium]
MENQPMRYKTRFILSILAGLPWSWQGADAGQLMVPHQDEDQVVVYTYPAKFAHPMDYWWNLNPSTSGSWDYFSPVADPYQPIVVEQGAPGTRALEVLGVSLTKLPASYASPQATGSPLYHGRGN